MTRIFTLRIFTQFGGLDAGGRTQSDLAKEFNVERTAVTRLNRKKNETISIAESNKDLNQKRQRKTGALLEKSLIWFKQSRAKNIPLSGPIFT